MLQRLRTWRPDPLIVLILVALALAIAFPARGAFAEGFGVATKLAIALLFFLYGARLSPREALDGLRHWRLHLTILALTFIAFPLLGLALKPLDLVLSPGLYLGVLYLTLVPSTVQSSVNFTSIARGNVAGAIVSASASNLLGIVITPVLVMLLMATGGGVHVDGSVFVDISLQLLLPFAIGQLTRRWTLHLAAARRTRNVDRISIAMVVYSAFSEGMVEGIWSTVPVRDLIVLCVLSVAMVELLLRASGALARRMGFNRADRIAIQFCGSKKSLATGLPMAAVIFGGDAGVIILPLMIFHQIQLMMCAWYAARWGREAEAAEAGAAG
ncbi:bile acid:sodium symporter family protein [Corynebacterium sphenisci]|uniref:bile acid:sodium symporter family protein n=1 Tax=Corynebacterium sphenisci TaxID=191493 RepID=UPI0026DF085A|nr:bile acid:sodium symporter family protein [Corynebacterium sphenisci]MDO5731959.1 bile acid:sodium symporter family protein [Corynebacterium sphenisci]